MSRAVPALVTATLLFATACGGDGGIEPPPPPAGQSGPGSIPFSVTVATGIEHGAILFTVTGGPVDSITARAGYEAFHSVTTGGARGIVFGALVNGPLLQVWVPDRSIADRYAVRVDEGAARGTYVTVAPESYAIARDS
jgi:hypothetical protein